jgi:hypothetical protein
VNAGGDPLLAEIPPSTGRLIMAAVSFR